MIKKNIVTISTIEDSVRYNPPKIADAGVTEAGGLGPRGVTARLLGEFNPNLMDSKVGGFSPLPTAR